MTQPGPNFILTPDEAPRSVDALRRQALRLLQQAGDDGDTASRATDYASPQIDPSPATSPAPARAVMVGLVTMPAVFIVVVMGALALFGKPAATQAPGANSAADVALLEQPSGAPAFSATLASARSTRGALAGITLGEDMRVADISLDGDRVALHVESPMGQEIVIYDYARGEVVAQAPIETASLEAVDSLAMLTGAPQGAPKVETPGSPAAVVEATPAVASVASVAAAPRAPSVKPRRAD